MLLEIPELHPWPNAQNEAVEIQSRLREHIIIESLNIGVKLIAGVDTAFDHTHDMLYAGVCLYSYPDMTECERATASDKASFSYVPGLHAFREGKVILAAMSRLRTKPDLVMFAGHGIAHPRQIGLASHLGLILDIPSIGCARKKLVGQHGELGPESGSSAPLIVDNKEVGRVYRTRENVKPVFISPGHRCNVEDASGIIIGCLRGYRIPEPLRAAHRLANRMKRNNKMPQKSRNNLYG